MCWGLDCNINSKSGIGIFLLFCIFFAGCKPALDEPKYTCGEADFSVYLAVGTSSTAGYMDNALTLERQLQCFPNLLANQFLLAGGGAFNQPLVNAGNGFGFDFGTQVSTGKWVLVNAVNCANQSDVELKALAVKYDFSYPNDKLIELAQKVKTVVDDKAKYTDWSKRDDIKAELKVDLIILLAENDYPPVDRRDWTIEDYKKLLKK